MSEDEHDTIIRETFEHNAQFVTIPCARYEALVAALEESVKLQSHYAFLLNIHDGGKRLRFANVDEWMKRLAQMEEKS